MKEGELVGDAGGVIGLARPNKKIYVAPKASIPDSTQSILASIESETMQSFSTRLSKNVVSWIDFGEPNADENIDAVTIGLNDDYFWSTSLESIQIGSNQKDLYGFSDEAEQSEKVGKGVYTVLDFNTPDIFLSALWYSDFLTRLSKKAGVEIK